MLDFINGKSLMIPAPGARGILLYDWACASVARVLMILSANLMDPTADCEWLRIILDWMILLFQIGFYNLDVT